MNDAIRHGGFHRMGDKCSTNAFRSSKVTIRAGHAGTASQLRDIAETDRTTADGTGETNLDHRRHPSRRDYSRSAARAAPAPST